MDHLLDLTLADGLRKHAKRRAHEGLAPVGALVEISHAGRLRVSMTKVTMNDLLGETGLACNAQAGRPAHARRYGTITRLLGFQSARTRSSYLRAWASAYSGTRTVLWRNAAV